MRKLDKSFSGLSLDCSTQQENRTAELKNSLSFQLENVTPSHININLCYFFHKGKCLRIFGFRKQD